MRTYWIVLKCSRAPSAEVGLVDVLKTGMFCNLGATCVEKDPLGGQVGSPVHGYKINTREHAHRYLYIYMCIYMYLDQPRALFVRCPQNPYISTKTVFFLPATTKDVGAFDDLFFLQEPHVQLRPWHWSLSCSWAKNPIKCVQFTKAERCSFPPNVPLISVLSPRVWASAWFKYLPRGA